MKKQLKFWCGILILGGILPFQGCGDDDDGPALLNIASVSASGTDFESGDPVSGIDLFAATSAEDVPLDVIIVATFSRDVDANTVTEASVALTENGNSAPVSVSTSGSTVTIDPTEMLKRGTTYSLSVSENVSATDGGLLNSSISLTFKTSGRAEVEPPQASSQRIYVTLDGSSDDQLGNYTLANEAAVTYTEDRFGQPNSAAYFDGDATIIEYNDGVSLITENFTQSMWVRIDTVDHFDAEGNLSGMFVFGIGNFRGIQLELHQWAKYNRMKYAQSFDNGAESTTAEDFTVWDLDGNLEEFEVNRGADFENNAAGGLVGLTVGKWAQIVFVYNASENKRYCYINGQLQRSTDFDDSTFETIQNITNMTFNVSDTQDEPSDPDYISPRLALGFMHGSDSKSFSNEPWGNFNIPTSQHYKGGMDDFRVWNVALTANEIQSLYDDEKP
ncbi:MAG: Ig-like domain-containing protein [Bacteroidota bacterium]